MTASAVAEVAARLVRARSTGTRISPPPELMSAADAVGWDIQTQTMHRLGAAIAGWKVALSPAGVMAAPILDSALLRSPARVHTRRLPKKPTLGIEAELAFRIGKPLPPRSSGGYTALEVASAIDSTHAAIELLESR